MYARLVSFSGVNPEKREEATATIREWVIPTLRGFDGFAGYIGLYDEDGGRAKGILSGRARRRRRRQSPSSPRCAARSRSSMGLTLESADLYEAPIVELEAVHVWP